MRAGADGMTSVRQALAGLKVVEFASYAAGPHIGKMLANFGAIVVHVESRARPDGFRLEYPPFKDGIPGLDRGGMFPYFNDSKYGVTLDLKQDAGLALARKLVAWCDVVIENMRPGVIDRLGLSYDTMRALNPGVVLLSSCNMGQTGPRAHTPGFGSQLSAQAGFCGLTGEPDGPPMLLYGPYIDFVASTMGLSALLAALLRKRTTGEGAWIDIAQYETGLHFLADALLDHHETGRDATRAGNANAHAVPHDAYPCAHGQWVALSCWSDAEFRALAAVIGEPAFATDARFATAVARRAHLAALDTAIATWTQTLSAAVAAEALQRAGVHAYEVNTIGDLMHDPQLVHRHVWRRRRHAVLGDQTYCFPAFDLSETPGDITAAGPRLGADNEAVFRNLIGLTDEEHAAYQRAGAFE
jgi:crotonobetainyl-CoA:carnitine CoA-transferase CaiB-like acyl-CoA transferase